MKVMKVSSTTRLRSLLLIALVCVYACPFLVSCSSDDDPDMTNEYYLVVEAKDEIIYRRGGLPPEPKMDMIGKITTMMMDTITRITLVHELAGELIVHDAGVQRSRDAEVITACDELYHYYIESGLKDIVVCKASLYRAKKLDGIIRKSHLLKVYRF